MPRQTVDVEKVTFYLSPERHRALKVEAAEKGCSMSDIVTDALARRASYVARFTNHDGGVTTVKE